MTTCLVIHDGTARLGPYGIDKFQGLGYDLAEVGQATHPLHVKMRDVIEHRSGRPIDKAIRSAPRVADADVILAFLEPMALTPSWLKARRIPPFSKKPLAMLACWLADELRTMPASKRRAVSARYRGVDLTMVWSSNQIDILTDSGFPDGTVESIPFGFAPEMYPMVDPSTRDGTLAAIGSDRGRDYPTLLNAMSGTQEEIHLYCKVGNLQGHSVPVNVRFHGTIPYEEYQQTLRRVGAVVVPTKKLAYPTGQTVALEAAGTGAPLVLTDTPAMREYFSDRTAIMVAPGDVGGWREAISEVAGNPSLRTKLGTRASEDVHSRFTYLRMWQRVDELFRARGWTR